MYFGDCNFINISLWPTKTQFLRIDTQDNMQTLELQGLKDGKLT